MSNREKCYQSMQKNEQNTFDFKRVHSTLFKSLAYTSLNTRNKGRKKDQIYIYQCRSYSLKKHLNEALCRKNR